MELTILRLSVGITENIGNYESLRVDSTREVRLGEGDDPAAARDFLMAGLSEDLAKLSNKFRP